MATDIFIEKALIADNQPDAATKQGFWLYIRQRAKFAHTDF